MKKIAVIGTGGTGYSVASELSNRGYEVWLGEAGGEETVEDYAVYDKKMELTGAIKGTAVIHAVTTDLGAVLEGAEHVICCTISNRDERVARAIAPHLMPGANVLLSAGNLGSLIYHRVFQEFKLENVAVGKPLGTCSPAAGRTNTRCFWETGIRSKTQRPFRRGIRSAWWKRLRISMS